MCMLQGYCVGLLCVTVHLIVLRKRMPSLRTIHVYLSNYLEERVEHTVNCLALLPSSLYSEVVK